MSVDVLIVGAGPVGLALAIGLRQHGLRIRIIDQKFGPSHEPRAAVIWPRATEVLDDLGLGTAIRDAANALSVVHFHSRGRELGVARLGTLESRYPCPLLIEQHVTERLLLDRLVELDLGVEWGMQADDLRCADAGGTVLLRAADGAVTRASAAWIVGCDGARSVVRKRMGIPFVGDATANLQLRQVDAVPRWRFPDDPTHGRYFLDKGACLGCFPVAEGAYRFFCYTDDPDPHRRDAPSARDAQALIARVAGTPELQFEQVTWLSRTRFQTRCAERLRVGRVFLAGDAAHVWPSLGGHGMSVGLRGAHNLAWKLAAVQRGEAGEELLDTYEVEERHAVASFLRLMPFNLVEQPSGPGGVLPREWLLRVGLRAPGLVPCLERALSDLDAHHPTTPLSPTPERVGARRLGRVQVGDRLPDVRVMVDGKGVQLHALLGYVHWTLLAPASLPAAACDALRSTLAPWSKRLCLLTVTPASTARPRLVPDGVLILIRPDRHVGLIVVHHEMPRLREYLERWVALPTGSIANASQVKISPTRSRA